MLITSYYKIRYKVFHKESQQSVIKTVKGADNQRRGNENDRRKRIAKKQPKKNKQRQKGARGKAIVKV